MRPLGYIPRLISTHIQKLMEMYPVVTIARPRQSGMTFTPAMVKNVEKVAKFVSDSLPPVLIYAARIWACSTMCKSATLLTTTTSFARRKHITASRTPLACVKWRPTTSTRREYPGTKRRRSIRTINNRTF